MITEFEDKFQLDVIDFENVLCHQRKFRIRNLQEFRLTKSTWTVKKYKEIQTPEIIRQVTNQKLPSPLSKALKYLEKNMGKSVAFK